VNSKCEILSACCHFQYFNSYLLKRYPKSAKAKYKTIKNNYNTYYTNEYTHKQINTTVNKIIGFV